MENADLVLDQNKLLTKESPLSPAKELEYRTKIEGMDEEVSDLYG